MVALQTSFYSTLPSFPEFSKDDSDFAFLLYDLVSNPQTQTLSLQLQRTVYTKFTNALEQIAKFEAGSISDFTSALQKKLSAKKRGSKGQMQDFENIVAE